jgi:hypothetical protein
MEQEQIQARAVLCLLHDIVLALNLDNVSPVELLDALEGAGLAVETGSTSEDDLAHMERARGL